MDELRYLEAFLSIALIFLVIIQQNAGGQPKSADALRVPIDRPIDITVNPNNDKFYITNQISKRVVIVDGKTNEPLSYYFGSSPSGIAVNPNNDMVYIANSPDFVSVTDGNTNKLLPINITVSDSPFGIAVNPS